jgi:hypothetical protein
MSVTKPNQKRIKLEQLAEVSNNVINSQTFLERARLVKSAFTRVRALTVLVITAMLINLVRATIQTALNDIWNKFDLSVGVVTQQSFSKARKKYNWEACRLLRDETVKAILSYDGNTWCGYHVMAIDGSKIQLPADAKLRYKFGTSGRNKSSPTAQSSEIYDVFNHVIIDARLVPMARGERFLATKHIDFLVSLPSFGKELIIFDRGYASNELMRYCESKNVKYLMRVRTKFNVKIDELPLGIHNHMLGDGDDKINLRVVKFELPSGEIETLLTNLFEDDITVEEFKWLYFQRWPIETQYGNLKNKLEIENFSSRLENGIYQEYYMTAFAYNVISVAAMEAQPIIDERRAHKNNKYKYKVNFNQAVATYKEKFTVAMFNNDPKKRVKLIEEIIEKMSRNVVPIRPGRSSPRNPNPRKAKFHFNKKSNC